jgi:uncharacterized protein (DUF433 family)
MTEQGVYTLAEVAKYTGVKPMTLRAWFLRRSDHAGLGPVFESDYERLDDDFAVSFLNLIEAFVASFFKQNKVTHQDIRRTHELLKRKLNVKHPFAFANLAVGLRRISLEDPDSRYCEVISRQLLFPEFNAGLHKISYDPDTNLANGWEVDTGIFVSPRVGFGKPVVQNTGVSTLIVARQYVANGKDAAVVARLFKIPKDGVESAFRFERRLGRIAA